MKQFPVALKNNKNMQLLKKKNNDKYLNDF